MKSSKLIDLLKSFSPDEMRDLSLFMEQQMDKKDTLPQKLFLVLEKYYPEFIDVSIEREKIFRKVFQKQEFNNNKFSKLMSELTKILELYIVYIKHRQDELTAKLHLLKYYFERNLDKYFMTAARDVRALIDALPVGSQKNIYKYQFEELITTYEIKIDNRKGNYLKVYSELNEFIEAEKLRWENLTLIEPFPIKYVNVAQQPFYVVHLMLQRLLTTKDDNTFIEILQYSENNLKQFAQEEAREILKILLFFALNKANNGYAEYYAHQLRIYQLFIDLKLILNYYGKIHMSTYKNYINSALKLKEFEKAEKFLEYYKAYLLDDSMESIYSFNKAFILFERGNFNEALKILLSIKIDDVYYDIHQRRIIVKAYYELLEIDESYFELFQSNINTFRKFLYTRTNVTTAHLDLNKNFVKYLQKIEDARKIGKQKAAKLLEEIEKVSLLGERQWLIEKIKKMH